MMATDDHPPITPEEEAAALAEHGGGPGPVAAPLRAVADQVTLYDTDAEAGLIGACLLNATTALDAIAGIAPEDFGFPAHGHIAAAIADLHAQGQPVDPVVVSDHLRRRGHLELAGGNPALLSLQASAPATTTAPRYAAIVSELALLRRFQVIGAEVGALATTAGATPVAMAAQVQTMLDEVHDRATATGSRLARVGDVLEDYLDTVEERSGQELTGITTGIDALDSATGGLQKGRLYTIAGRPGLGKSDVAVALARAAATSGRRTLFVSIEMATAELLDRWVAGSARITATSLAHGKLSPRDWDRVNPAIGELVGLPLWVDDDPNASVASIRAAVRRTDAELVIVDYLQLLDTPKGESRQIEVTAIARALKNIARTLEVPVVALAQLNRGVEARTDKRPMLSDLRESGAIEQESDVVIGLYRDDYYNADSADRGVLELLLLKNRSGATTTVRCAYFPDTKIIANLAGAN